jgi:nucleotide-binding universal stress UspA family protein
MSEAIVVGTNGSETARRAVAEAARIARAIGAEIHVVSAYEGSTAIAGDFVIPPVGEDLTEETLAEAVEALRSSEVPVTVHSARGAPADALLEVAAAVGATMIVVGNQGMHGARRILGSVPNSVSHRARCNVLIVQTDTD